MRKGLFRLSARRDNQSEGGPARLTFNSRMLSMQQQQQQQQESSSKQRHTRNGSPTRSPPSKMSKAMDLFVPSLKHSPNTSSRSVYTKSTASLCTAEEDDENINNGRYALGAGQKAPKRWKPRKLDSSCDLSLDALGPLDPLDPLDSSPFEASSSSLTPPRPTNGRRSFKRGHQGTRQTSPDRRTNTSVCDTSASTSRFCAPTNSSDYSLTNTQLGPCVACNIGQRTHLAMPCMHLAYCEDCVYGMQEENHSTCLVCHRDGVSFTEVFI